MTVSWSTGTEFDASQSEDFVHHSQPTGTQWAGDTTLEMGFSEVSPPGTYQAYWPMEEASGSTMNEVSGSGANDGTINGVTVGQTPGPFGLPYYEFDGANPDYVDCGTGNFVVGSFTLFWWFYYATDRTTGNRFFSLQGDIRIISVVGRNTTNEITTFYNGSWRDTGSTASSGTWHSLAIVYDDTAAGDQNDETLNVYLDATNIYSTGVGTPLQSGNGTTCAFGTDDDLSTSPYTGRMAQFVAFDSPFTQAQVQDLHDAAL